MSIATSLASVPGAELRRAAETMMAGAADITLLVDSSGVIRSASMSNRMAEVDAAVIEGVPIGTVFEGRDRPALEALLATAGKAGGSAVELRHLPPVSTEAPVRYTALGRGDGAVLLVGRLLPGAPRAAVAPKALIADRDAGRRLAVEARYRALFESAAEAVLIVSLESGLVEEANPRAMALLDAAPDMLGRPLAALFDREVGARLGRHLAAAQGGGEFAPLRVRLAGSGRTLGLQGRVFRAFDRTQLMLRVAEPGASGADQPSPAIALVARLMRESQNALALTDRAGRIIWTNGAFDALSGDLHGRTVGELTEFPAPVLDAILRGARDRGRISLADARLRLDARHPAASHSTEGRLTVIALPDDCAAGFGLVFRPADDPSAALPADPTPADEVGAAADTAPGVPDGTNLKELLRDATDTIERSCIDAALKLTGGNRAAAAKVLGLSRQSLYVKMRRFGLV